MPICTKCSSSVEAPIQSGQDQTTFICESCQDKANVGAWKAELKELTKLEKGKKANSSQIRRAGLIRKKLQELG